jgi:protocatechuate 3,4-dioxygenase beta subunit
VRDLSDKPLPGIQVQVQRGWGRIEGYQWARNFIWSESPVWFSDEGGRFILRGAIPGKLWLSAHHPTYGWTGTQLEGQEGQRITDLIISFTGATISGTVLTREGEPVPGARVHARGPKNTPGQRTRQTSSDGLGRFKLGGLREGVYDLGASISGAQVEPVKGVPAGSSEVELKLKATQVLRGEVTSARTGRALERFTLSLQPRRTPGTKRRGTTSWQGEVHAPDGRWERPVAPGVYTLLVKAPGHAPRVLDGVVVEELSAPQPVHASLDAGGGIRGTARDSGGEPLRRTHVRANIYRGPGEARSPIDWLLGSHDLTDSRGRFFIESLAPGTYLLQLNLGRRGSAFAQVTVAGAEMVRRDLQLLPTGTVVLEVTDEEGRPLPGVSFHFRSSMTGNWMGFASPSNAQGISTSQPLPMGDATVQALHDRTKYVADSFPVTIVAGETIHVEVAMKKKQEAPPSGN